MASKKNAEYIADEEGYDGGELSAGAYNPNENAAPKKPPVLPGQMKPSRSTGKAMQEAFKILGHGTASKNSVAPDIQKIFPNAKYLSVDTSAYGMDFTPAQGKDQIWKRKETWLPEDIYDPELDHNVFAWFVLFMHPFFGDEILEDNKSQREGLTKGAHYVKRVMEVAHGWGCKPVPFLRQQISSLLRDRKFCFGIESLIEANRDEEDDDDDRMENQGLAALLEYSTYSQLQNEARRFDCKPETLLCAGIANAIDGGVFQP